ncbi:MAG: 2Fe-2S iron-sulfur cluster-binding protein [Sphingomonadaceae bacterium]|nr:2Fe-2S iron-sulfur cluster-binding protein [Sphingomonadaceae bacterium]
MAEQFFPLTVAEVRPETAEAVSIRLDPPADARARFAFRAGQHLTLRAVIGGADVRRNYSLCVSPLDGELRIAVKRIAGGVFSNWANEALVPGATIEAMPPHGSFTFDFAPAHARNYLGIAGGSGITPVLSLARTALAVEPGSRFTLLYGNRASHTVMFLEDIAALKDRHIGRFAAYHFLEDEADEIELLNGRLDEAKWLELIGTLVDPATVDAAFVCGPGPMMDAAETALLAAGLPRERVLIERFTAGRPSASVAAAMAARVEAAQGLRFGAVLDGRKRMVAFDAVAGNILDSARAAGLPAPYACKAGVCATCRARVVSGRVEMAARYGLTDEEVAAGYVLTCQTVPLSDDVVIDYDG